MSVGSEVLGETDTEVLEGLDFEQVLDCDGQDCPIPAAWLWRCGGCPSTVLCCTYHKQQIQSWLATDSAMEVVCAVCRARYSNLLEFTRL